jgi:hypothetical protein
MGQMFGNFNWTADTVTNVDTTYQLPAHLAARLTSESLLPAINQLSSVDHATIAECFEDCPNSWRISPEEKAAGVRCAIQARRNINNIIFYGNPQIR